MSKVTFEVTQEMIDNSVCGNTRLCIIATGLNSLLDKQYFAVVYPTIFRCGLFSIFTQNFVSKKKIHTGRLPEDANSYANQFDTGRSNVKPGVKFEFDIPDKLLKHE